MRCGFLLADYRPSKIIMAMNRDEAIAILAPYNLRDLSYLPKDKPVLPRYSFFRCAALRKMNRKSLEALKALNIATVIDLRTNVEVHNKPDDAVEGIEYRHIPILKEELMGFTHGRGVFAYKTPPHMPTLYASVITNEESLDAIKSVFDVILDPARKGAIAWHCTAGKDRAGIVTALFLYAIGVSEEEILGDYVLSNATSEPKGRLYRGLVRAFMWNWKLAEAVYQTMLAVPEYLNAAFDAIKKQWGDIPTFLDKRLGVTKERIKAFLDKQVD